MTTAAEHDGAAAAADPSLSSEQRLQLAVQRLKQTTTLPPSAERIRLTLDEFRSLLQLHSHAHSHAAAASADAASTHEATTAMLVNATAGVASPSPLVSSFCAQGGHAALTAWMWRREIASQIAAHLMDQAEEYVFVWYADPFPATDAFQALTSATRSVGQWSASGSGGPVSASSRGVHSLLRTALHRFIELQPRVAQLLEEVCQFEARRTHAKSTRDASRLATSQATATGSATAAAARAQVEREVQRAHGVMARAAASALPVPTSAVAVAAAAAPLSPQSQMLIDTLCSLPDLLASALHGDLPYSLSHRAWYTGVVAQTQLLISAHSNAAESLTARHGQSPSFLAPLSSLLAKLVRLGQSEVLLDGLLEPLLLHLQSLQPSSATAVAASSSSAPTTSASSIPSSPLLAAYACIFQGVGVQAQEKLVESILQWLGSRLYALHAARGNDSEDAQPSSDPSERALLSVMPALFPLAYFSSSPFFSLLVSQRLFVSKTSLSLPALRVLVDYLWHLSVALLDGQNGAAAARTRSSHQTLLDQVLTSVLQVWSGGEQSTTAAGVQHVSHSMAAELQVYLGKAALLMLLKIEKEMGGGGPMSAKERAARAQKKKAEGENEEAFKQLGSFAHSAAVPLLLTGIHSRLSSPLPPVRAVAMAIARVFSRLMGGAENEIDFGESDAAALEEEEAKEAEEARRNQAAALNPATIINPQHLAGAAATSAGGITSGTPLQAHSLADDEKDLRKVRLPFFLRDALDLLHKHADSMDHIEAALECLPPLISRHPADLRLLARDLMAALLNLGSNVFLETSKKLAAWRTQAMVTLCSTPGGRGGTDVAALSESVSYLIAQFWSSNYSIGTKLEILDILRMAAERLADMHGEGDVAATAGAIAPGVVKPRSALIEEVSSTSSRPLVPINTPSYSSSSTTQAVSATLAHHQSIIAERVEKRTRRWGSTKTAMAAAAASSAQPKKYSVNRFAPVAHLFFFPLMRQIDSAGAQTVLQQHDGLLLLRLLHTVSALLPCSSGLSQSLPLITRTMARALMDFLLVTATRTHAAAAVAGAAGHPAQQIAMRRMIFFALSRILVCYNEQLFADDFSREIPELVSWLSDSVQNDKDLECRQLAQACLYFLKQLLGNPFEAMFKSEANAASHAATIAGSALPALRF